MKKLLPLDISDFKQLITENYYYIDKTLLIKEILTTSGNVTLLDSSSSIWQDLESVDASLFF